MNVGERVEAVEAALEKADDRLAFLDRVPLADSMTARHAADGLRLEVLDQLREDVAAAVGRSVPTPPVVEEEPPKDAA